MSFLERPITILKMGLRQHEAILAPVGDRIKGVMEAHNWTCHRCGVRVPGYMQVDHTKGHGNSAPEGLRPICVFCHDQDHILWAAGRKRVFPILAPELTNEQVSRIAWAVLALQNASENTDAVGAVENMTAAFRQRHHDFQQKYGSADADSAIEALFRFLIREGEETERETAKKKKIAGAFISETRFVPRLLSGSILEDPSETVSVWTLGGFAAPARTPSEAVGLPVEPDTLVAAVSAVLQEASE